MPISRGPETTAYLSNKLISDLLVKIGVIILNLTLERELHDIFNKKLR